MVGISDSLFTICQWRLLCRRKQKLAGEDGSGQQQHEQEQKEEQKEEEEKEEEEKEEEEKEEKRNRRRKMQMLTKIAEFLSHSLLRD